MNADTQQMNLFETNLKTMCALETNDTYNLKKQNKYFDNKIQIVLKTIFLFTIFLFINNLIMR